MKILHGIEHQETVTIFSFLPKSSGANDVSFESQCEHARGIVRARERQSSCEWIPGREEEGNKKSSCGQPVTSIALFRVARKWKRSAEGLTRRQSRSRLRGSYEEVDRGLSLASCFSLSLPRYVASSRRCSPLNRHNCGSIISAGAAANGGARLAGRDGQWAPSGSTCSRVVSLAHRCGAAGGRREGRGGVSRVWRQPSLDTSYSGGRISRSPTS